jgi:type VI secretion system protein ImpM
MATTWIGCFGKLPIFGDFLRHNAFSAAVRALDVFFQEGLRSFEDHHGEAWKREFAAIRPCRFLFSPQRDGAGLAGVFVPGIDKAGRHFPFVIYWESSAATPPEAYAGLPLTLAPVMQDAERLATQGWQDLTPAELYTAIDRIDLGRSPETPPEPLAARLGAATLDQLWGRALGRVATDPSVDDARFVVLQNLLDLLRPDYTARFVLATPGSGASLECAFWLELALGLTGGRGVPTFCAWTADAGEPGSSFVRMLFDAARAHYFQPLMRPDLDSRKMCRMAVDGLQSAERIARSRESFGHLLERGDTELSGFIEQFIRLRAT